MLFKFTFLPDIEKTQDAMTCRNPGVSAPEIQEAVTEVFSHVYSPSYDLFVKADNIIAAHRRLNGWFDEPSCFLNLPDLEPIVFTLIVECVSVSDVDTILNAVDILE